jgi:hypothetical protein
MGKNKTELTQNQVAIRWAVRVFVLGTLVVLLVLAVLEFRAKSHSQATAEAWVEKHDAAGGSDCRLGELEDLVVGNPSKPRRGELSDLNDARDSRSVVVYHWKGAFNTYAVYIGVLDFAGIEPENYIVETIEGPRKL